MMTEDFHSWYEAEYRRVLAITTLAVGSDFRTAEEATAEAFVKAFEQWSTVSVMDNPRAWVARTAINNARTIGRRVRRLLSFNTETHDRVHQDQIRGGLDEFWNELDALTERQRVALVLRYVDDLTQRQVGEALGISEGTASATLAQARKKLRASTHLKESP